MEGSQASKFTISWTWTFWVIQDHTPGGAQVDFFCWTWMGVFHFGSEARFHLRLLPVEGPFSRNVNRCWVSFSLRIGWVSLFCVLFLSSWYGSILTQGMAGGRRKPGLGTHATGAARALEATMFRLKPVSGARNLFHCFSWQNASAKLPHSMDFWPQSGFKAKRTASEELWQDLLSRKIFENPPLLRYG